MKTPRKPATCDCGHHAFVAATKGRVILTDVEDIGVLGGRCWCLTTKGYAGRLGGKLHRDLLNAPDGSFVDHINGDKLENRRANLRLCSPEQSIRNRGKLKRTGAKPSRFKGVSWYPRQGWVARITTNGKRTFLGAFSTELEAARAYDRAAMEQHGAFARLNIDGGVLSLSEP